MLSDVHEDYDHLLVEVVNIDVSLRVDVDVASRSWCLRACR